MRLRDKIATHYVIAAPTVWYHGRKNHSQEFSLDYVGNGSDQEGPGFYFSTNESDAAGYAAPNGIVMTATLKPRKLVEGKPKRSEIIKLIKMAPDVEDKLMDFDENPARALNMAADGAMRDELAKDAFQQVWVDFYRYKPKEYLQNLVKMGYDGHQATWLKGEVQHMIIYNPAVIHIESVEPYEG